MRGSARRARDGPDEVAVAGADQQRVMQQRRLHAVRPEVEQEARHRRPQPPQRRARSPSSACVRSTSALEITTSAGMRSPPSSQTARTPARVRSIDLHARAAAHVQRARHRLDQRVDAAVGVPAAVEHLQVGQRRVDRRHAERVAADEQRVERERLAHPRVPEVARDEAVQRHDRPEPRHPRQQRARTTAGRRTRAGPRRGCPPRRSAAARRGSRRSRAASRCIEAGDLLAQPLDGRERSRTPARSTAQRIR